MCVPTHVSVCRVPLYRVLRFPRPVPIKQYISDPQRAGLDTVNTAYRPSLLAGLMLSSGHRSGASMHASVVAAFSFAWSIILPFVAQACPVCPVTNRDNSTQLSRKPTKNVWKSASKCQVKPPSSKFNPWYPQPSPRFPTHDHTHL